MKRKEGMFAELLTEAIEDNEPNFAMIIALLKHGQVNYETLPNILGQGEDSLREKLLDKAEDTKAFKDIKKGYLEFHTKRVAPHQSLLHPPTQLQ